MSVLTYEGEPDVEAAVLDMLSSSDPLRDEVGVRIFHAEVSQTAGLPCVTYLLVASPSIATHDGPTGQARSLVQVDVWAATKAQLARIANLVRVAMNASGSYGGIVVYSTQKVGEQTFFDPELKARRRMLEFAVNHTEEVTEAAS